MTIDQVIKAIAFIFIVGFLVGYLVPKKIAQKIDITVGCMGCLFALASILMTAAGYHEKDTILTVLGIGVSFLIFLIGSGLGFYVETKCEKKS